MLANMSLPDSDPYSERRRLRRQRSFRRARCVFNGGASTLDVTVRDISPTGARIAGDELIWLPHTFELQIYDSAGAYACREARLKWLKGSLAGVEFVD